jgi:hypothetical protein
MPRWLQVLLPDLTGTNLWQNYMATLASLHGFLALQLILLLGGGRHIVRHRMLLVAGGGRCTTTQSSITSRGFAMHGTNGGTRKYAVQTVDLLNR